MFPLRLAIINGTFIADTWMIIIWQSWKKNYSLLKVFDFRASPGSDHRLSVTIGNEVTFDVARNTVVNLVRSPLYLFRLYQQRKNQRIFCIFWDNTAVEKALRVLKDYVPQGCWRKWTPVRPPLDNSLSTHYRITNDTMNRSGSYSWTLHDPMTGLSAGKSHGSIRAQIALANYVFGATNWTTTLDSLKSTTLSHDEVLVECHARVIIRLGRKRKISIKGYGSCSSAVPKKCITAHRDIIANGDDQLWTGSHVVENRAGYRLSTAYKRAETQAIYTALSRIIVTRLDDGRSSVTVRPDARDCDVEQDDAQQTQQFKEQMENFAQVFVIS